MFSCNEKFRKELAELRDNVKLCQRSLGIPDLLPGTVSYLLCDSTPLFSIVERVDAVAARVDRLLDYLKLEDAVIDAVPTQRVIRKKPKSTKTTKREK